jgi:hypothetical protein
MPDRNGAAGRRVLRSGTHSWPIWYARGFGFSGRVSNFVRPPGGVASREMISKLIKAGYLKPTQRNNADAITEAIARMKRDLRDARDRSADKNGDQKAT